MVFTPVFDAVCARLKRFATPQKTLYIGSPHLCFPKVTTFRIHAYEPFEGYIPFEARAIEYVFAQMHGSIPPPFLLQQELLRTCRSGLLTMRSPLAAISFDLPTDSDDERYAIWTEISTNRLCFLPLPWHQMTALDTERLDRWKDLTLFNPLFLYNLYAWDHPMDLNLKVYPPNLDAEEFQCVLEEACEASAFHTQSWLLSHDPTQK
jgi:hypothetical protein